MKGTRRSGFSVASLMLLTAVVAVYVAAIASARNMEPAPKPEELAGYAVLGLLFGLVCGFFLGMTFGNGNRDLALGVAEGAVFGPPTAVLLAIPDSVPVVLVGGVILVGFALVIRLFTPKSDANQEARDPME